MAWFGNFLKRSLLGEHNPNKVLEVNSEKYSDRLILCREDCIFLYAGTETDQKNEIVMHRPCSESLSQAYSLFRSEDRTKAQENFLILKDKLPFLCNLSNSSLGVIQKYCTILLENPSWNICHCVVYFNLLDAIQNPQVVTHINSSDPRNGMSPLHLAAKEANLQMITRLMQHEASTAHLDHDGNSVFHYAAVTNREVIMALSSDSKALNKRNSNGYTPLHVACLADKPDCVTALLVSGADVNISAGSPGLSTTPPGIVADLITDYSAKLLSQEMKYGGTPLHWSSSKEVIDALLDRNCDIDALNFASRTALHVMVMRNRLECVVALLSREADTSIADSNGDTALHLAVKEKNIPIVQALIVFGADLALLNNEGKTARHLAAVDNSDAASRILYILHAVGAARCPFLMDSCRPGCSPEGTENGIPPPPASAPATRLITTILQTNMQCPSGPIRGGRILCLDGGGIRGLVLVTLLLHLESVVGKPIVHCFDWVAATSTGAILALALAAGKNLKECLCLYFRLKDHAFAGFRPYSSEPLETMLKETLGTDTTMTDIKHPKLMIAGCLADRKPVELHLFRNYPGPEELLGDKGASKGGPDLEPVTPYREQLLWEAARASGAAPSYFRAFGRFVDGGLIANNPTLDALTEIHELNTCLRMLDRAEEVDEVSVVVSLGTGSVPLVKVESVDVFWPSTLWETTKAMSGVRSMQAVLVDQATLADGRLIDRARATCSMLGKPYFRFSPQLSEDIAMDEKSDAKLVNMLWETKAYIMSQDQLVNKLATMLC